MEYNKEYTRLYWSLIAEVLLATPNCKDKKCQKCKYKKLCEFTIAMSEV